MIYGIKQTLEVTDTSVDLILYSLIAEIFFVIFACLTIRCPECKLKWVWHAVSKKDANQWSQGLALLFSQVGGLTHVTLLG